MKMPCPIKSSTVLAIGGAFLGLGVAYVVTRNQKSKWAKKQVRFMYMNKGGIRGDPARLAFHIGNVPFEDIRDGMKNLRERFGEKSPMGSFPALEIDGMVVNQSFTILRYAGKMAGLYPASPKAQTMVDCLLDNMAEVIGKVLATAHSKDKEAKLASRKNLAEGAIPKLLATSE